MDWVAMNSCNGLLVMETLNTNEMVICNPCTREFVDIPPLIITGNDLYSMVSGFGYNPSTNEYKIVVVCYKEEYHQSHQPGQQPQPQPGKVSVYTLGSGKWRDKGEISQEFGYNYSSNYSSHLNGSVYWVVQSTSEIVSFNLETEEFRIVPSPPLPPGMYYENLGSLGGCLYVIRKLSYNTAEVLVRNKEDHTWSLKFSITYKELGSDCRPLAILTSGKILWNAAHRKPCVVYYDPETESLEMDESFLQFKSWIKIIHYEKSLVSLKALGEMNARIYDFKE